MPLGPAARDVQPAGHGRIGRPTRGRPAGRGPDPRRPDRHADGDAGPPDRHADGQPDRHAAARCRRPSARRSCGASKWGIGVYREGNTIFDDLYASRPGVILLMDPSEGWARRIRACFPRAFIVGRRYLNEVSQPLDDPEARGTALADAVADSAARCAASSTPG